MTRSRLVLVAGILTGLFAAGYGVMFTVLDDFRDEYGISSGALGGVVAIGFFASFAAQVLIAPLADRGHARRLVYLGLLANLVGLLAMAFAEDLVLLLAARTLMGLGAGSAIPALRRIVVLADPGNLGTNIGRLLAADVAGFAVGPAVSAVLVGPLGLPAPFLAVAVLSVVCLVPLTRVRVEETREEEQPEARFAFDLLRQRAFAGAVMMGAAVFMMIGTFDALWVLVLDDLEAAEWIANLGITLFAVPLFFLGPAGGRLSQRVGPFRVGAVGLTLGAVFMASYGQLPTAVAMLVVSLFHALSDGMTVSASGVAVGLVAPQDRMAGAQGLLGGVQTLLGGVAAMLAGFLYDEFGRGVAYGVCAAVMVALTWGGIALVGPAWSRRPEPEPDPATADATSPATT